MRQVTIDPVARIARAEAGAVWHEVVEAAAEHGLAALAGSSPDVGVVGYTIGGGMSWLGRAYGLSANNVEAIELVTADGRLVRADACTEPDLFWALRGGGGSFGVVTAIELRLFPITEVYAGLLWWPAEPGRRGAAGLAGADPERPARRVHHVRPAGATSRRSPTSPRTLRGQSFVVIDVIHLGAPAEADALLAPLRALRPVTDTIETIPAGRLSHLHMDPEQPVARRRRRAHARQPARRGDRRVRPRRGPAGGQAAGRGRTAPRRRRDEAGPAGQRRAGRDRRRLRPVRGGPGALPAGGRGGRVRSVAEPCSPR